MARSLGVRLAWYNHHGWVFCSCSLFGHHPTFLNMSLTFSRDSSFWWVWRKCQFCPKTPPVTCSQREFTEEISSKTFPHHTQWCLLIKTNRHTWSCFQCWAQAWCWICSGPGKENKVIFTDEIHLEFYCSCFNQIEDPAFQYTIKLKASEHLIYAPDAMKNLESLGDFRLNSLFPHSLWPK